MAIISDGSVLEREMQKLVERELPDSDTLTAKYLARLFATAHMPRWEEIRWYWAGLRKETLSPADSHVIGEKLDLSRKVGDGCLTLCVFYRGDDKPRSIRVAAPPEEPQPSAIPGVDKRRFANEYKPVPLDRPTRSNKPVEPELEIAGLGRASYNTAGFYSAMLGNQETHVYPTLSEKFLQIIAKLGPAILRNYLGVINPPQRIVVYTPHGEMLFRLRNSPN